MKRFAALLSILMLAGAGCSAPSSQTTTNESTSRQTPPSIAIGEGDLASAGVITSINLDGMAADGPAVIIIKTDTGTETIHVPSSGLNLCAAKDQIADVSKLKVGDRVEVNGKIGAEGELTPCESARHYLRVADAKSAALTDEEIRRQNDALIKLGTGESLVRDIVASILPTTETSPEITLLLKTQSGQDAGQAFIPVRNLDKCAVKKENISDVDKLKVGDLVDIRGSIGTGGGLSPCSSADHYLRIVTK